MLLLGGTCAGPSPEARVELSEGPAAARGKRATSEATAGVTATRGAPARQLAASTGSGCWLSKIVSSGAPPPVGPHGGGNLPPGHGGGPLPPPGGGAPPPPPPSPPPSPPASPLGNGGDNEEDEHSPPGTPPPHPPALRPAQQTVRTLGGLPAPPLGQRALNLVNLAALSLMRERARTAETTLSVQVSHLAPRRSLNSFHCSSVMTESEAAETRPPPHTGQRSPRHSLSFSHCAQLVRSGREAVVATSHGQLLRQ